MSQDIDRASISGLFLCPRCHGHTIHSGLVSFSRYLDIEGVGRAEIWTLDVALRCVWCGMTTDELVLPNKSIKGD